MSHNSRALLSVASVSYIKVEDSFKNSSFQELQVYAFLAYMTPPWSKLALVLGAEMHPNFLFLLYHNFQFKEVNSE